jgi:hypothetical protein
MHAMVGIFCCFLWISSCWDMEKKKRGYQYAFFSLVFFISTVFILSIVCFGIWMIVTSYKLKNETQELLLLSTIKAQPLSGFEVLRDGMFLGTSSFVLVLITLIGMWLFYNKSRKKQRFKLR